MIYTSEDARHNGVPIHRALVLVHGDERIGGTQLAGYRC